MIEDDSFEDDDSDYTPPVKKHIANKHKTQKEFINEMFKNSNSDNDEKEIAKYYSNLSNDDKDSMFNKLT